MIGGKVTMQQIADALGISKVSVSKAIKHQDGVGPELRQKILEVASEMGYVYKPKATEIHSKALKFAFFTPKRYFFENENFYSQIFYCLNKQCSQHRSALSIFIINAEDEKNLTIPAMFSEESFDGIFIGGEMDTSYIQSLLHFNIPIILIDFYKPMLDLDCILVDNFYIGYQATTYLIHNGHTTIGFVGNPSQASSIIDRFYGYSKALAEHHLSHHPEWHLINNDASTGLYTENFDLPEQLPSAFVCFCDMAAFYLIKKLNGMAIHVPDDISVISFDNTEISQNCNPALTTVDISKRQLAEAAFSHMILRLEDPQGAKQRVIVSTQIKIRDSVRNIVSGDITHPTSQNS